MKVRQLIMENSMSNLDELRDLVENELGINPLFDPNISGRDVDDAIRIISQYTQQETLKSRMNEVGKINMGDVRYPEKRLDELKAQLTTNSKE